MQLANECIAAHFHMFTKSMEVCSFFLSITSILFSSFITVDSYLTMLMSDLNDLDVEDIKEYRGNECNIITDVRYYWGKVEWGTTIARLLRERVDYIYYCLLLQYRLKWCISKVKWAHRSRSATPAYHYRLLPWFNLIYLI